MTRNAPQVEIRPLARLAEFAQCERIQRAVWGTAGASAELLGVTAKYSGAVLGARVNGRMVGFVYAFLARYRGRLVHWSHLMAVEAGYRDLGLGFRMKLAHRRLALALRLKSICWTYDPLQSRNAFLNVARLGGRVTEYVPDCYGQFPSRIEKGLPSDRFVVDWRIASRVAAHLLEKRRRQPAGLGAPCVNQTRTTASGFIRNRALDLGLGGSRLRVEVPPDTDAMRATDLRLARRWRLETRKIFQHYFARGYRVEDFIPPRALSAGHCYYVLRRKGA